MNQANKTAIENLNALQDLIIPNRGYDNKTNKDIEMRGLDTEMDWEDYLNAQDMLEELKSGQEEE